MQCCTKYTVPFCLVVSGLSSVKSRSKKKTILRLFNTFTPSGLYKIYSSSEEILITSSDVLQQFGKHSSAVKVRCRQKAQIRPSKCPKFYTTKISGETNLRKKECKYCHIEIAKNCRII